MVIIGVEHYEVAFFTHFDTADRVGTVECSRPIQGKGRNCFFYSELHVNAG